MPLLWLALRVRWRRAWGRSLALAVLIGGVGGFVVAAATSARQVESAYRNLSEEIGAPDAVVIRGCERIVAGFGCVAPPEQVSGDVLVERLEHLDVVEEARSIEAVSPYFVDATGAPLLATADDAYGCFDDDRSVFAIALAQGGAAEQPMPFRLDGEIPARGGTGVVLALATARRVGLGVGDDMRLAGFCTGEDEGRPTEFDQPIDLTVTGVGVGPLDIEPPGTGLTIEPAYVDRAIIEQLVSQGAELQTYASVWLDPAVPADAVGDALEPYEVSVDLRERAGLLEDALATDARLLWLLAGLGAVGAILVLAPIVDRNVRDTANDGSIMAALGGSRTQDRALKLAHVGVIALMGGFLAAVVSPFIGAFMPRGFAAAIAPERPGGFDAAVTFVGFVLLVCAVVAIGALSAVRSTDETRVARESTHRRTVLGLSRLGPASRSGVLTALGSPAGPRRPTPWPSFISMVVAGATCVASLTYLAGLDHFKRTPSLMGWNWDAGIGFEQEGAARMPAILAELAELEGIQRVTPGTLYPPTFLGVPGTEIVVWPWSFATGPQAITPTMLSGRAPDGPDEVAIDSAFAQASGLDVGDSVSLSRPAMVSVLANEFQQLLIESGVADTAVEQPDEPPIVSTFEITGFAVLPLQRTEVFPQAALTLEGLAALVEPDEDEVSVAARWVPDDLPAEVQVEVAEFLSNTDIEDRGLFLRFSGDLQSTADAIARIEGVGEVVAPNPEQVLTIGIGLNLTHHHRVPNALVYLASSSALALLMYLLVTAVRARRFEFAIMRALGLSSNGVRRSVAAQATATAVIPLLLAIPIGVVVGRRAWTTQAVHLEVVPEPAMPWLALALVVATTVVVANLVVLIPGSAAARRSPDADLRAG